MRKVVQLSSTLVMFLSLLSFSQPAQAESVQEWFCRLVRYPNCGDLGKLISVRSSAQAFASTIVIYDPVTGSRKYLACGQCRDPLPISSSQVAVRTDTGLAVVNIDSSNELQNFALPGIRHLLAWDPSNSTWVVAVGDGICPQLALFDPATGQLSRAGVPDYDENKCPLPRPGRIKNDEQLVLSGDEMSGEIFSRSIERPADDSKLVVPRAPDDRSIWFDPQWFGHMVIYAIH
jgi:hypothetical protein